MTIDRGSGRQAAKAEGPAKGGRRRGRNAGKTLQRESFAGNREMRGSQYFSTVPVLYSTVLG